MSHLAFRDMLKQNSGSEQNTFELLLKTEDWDGIFDWHLKNTPWCT